MSEYKIENSGSSRCANAYALSGASGRHMKIRRNCIVACFAFCLLGGCGSQFSIGDFDFAALLANSIGLLQTRPQNLPPVLVDRGDTIVINSDVTIINNPAEDISYSDLPDLTVLGFENDTNGDFYIRYYADGYLQGIFVYQGEALLLAYPCLSIVELISEDDIDPFTGELVNSFDLTGNEYFNPGDFFCGDALILNIDAFSVHARAEIVDLTP